MIYADNAATTKMCPAAIEAMTRCMEENYGNPLQPVFRRSAGKGSAGGCPGADRKLPGLHTPGDHLHLRRQRGR